MKKYWLFALPVICLQIILNTAVLAQQSELIYIDEGFISNAAEGWDITDSLNWDFTGSAPIISRSVVAENDEKFLALSAAPAAEGGRLGSYYLYGTYYAITGEGSIDFDIRLNEGKMKFVAGDNRFPGDLAHSAFSLIFDSDNGEITLNDNAFDYTFEKAVWYSMDIDFDVRTKQMDISFSDALGNVVAENNGVAFETSELQFISGLTFLNGDGKMFSSDIRNFSFINKNSRNKSGGYMSITENNVMKNTFPESAVQTRELIDNQPAVMRQMEYLTRGLVATKRTNDVYLSWRWLGTEDIKTGYNIYRDGVKINNEPIYESTNYIDTEGTLNSKYTVKSVINGTESDVSGEVGVNPCNAITIPLLQYDYENYSSGDGMVGDLDGDGEYEILVHRYPEDELTSANYPLVEAYELDGTHMWTMNIGPNDLEPKQNPIMVYDLDGDGKSEIVMRIGDDFTDGTGVSVGDMDGDGMTNYRDYVYSGQYLEKGPEYLAVFEGESGALLDKVPFDGVLARDPLINWGNGNSITHRPWKFMFTPLKIDDGTPAFVICRGIYARTGIKCYKFIDKKLTLMWDFDSNNHFGYTGQGNHNLTSGDVDFDGYDELVYAGMAVDNDGSPLYTTQMGHGDAIHMSDFVPDRPGLEVMKINESSTAYTNCAMFDARTGEVLWGEYAARDTGRVLCADTDPRFAGAETQTNNKVFDCYGNVIDSQSGSNFAIYWDGDLLREINDDITVSKYMAYDGKTIPLFVADNCRSNNSTKANCTIQADLFGDWREEIVLPTLDGKALQIFTTTCPTTYKLYTLMHDPIYRAAVAWQNNAYNQPPHLGFNWGYDVKEIPVPKIYTVHNGTTKESPYSDSNRVYAVNGAGESFYSDDESNTVLINGYPHLAYTGTGENSEASAETQKLLGHITAYYDEVVKTGGAADYVSLPSTKVYLPGQVRFVCDEDFTITDINGIPIENLTDTISYDAVNRILTVSENNSVWIKVKGESFTQIFNLAGSQYSEQDAFLYDTLDEKALGSGNDFLDGRMNINGWALRGDRKNTAVITYADSTYSPKKRLVQVKNNSDEEAIFYLNRPRFNVNGRVTAEFELQLRKGETEFENEFMLSGSGGVDTAKKSLSVKQVGDKLYIGTNGEYMLFASGLSCTTGSECIYKIVASMDFSKKVSDIMLLYADNVISTAYNVPFYDNSETGIESVLLSSQPGSEIGIDDINIRIYTGIYAKSAVENDTLKLQRVKLVNNIGIKNAVMLIGVYNTNGECISVKKFDVNETNSDFVINETYDDNVSIKCFLWDSMTGLKPVL